MCKLQAQQCQEDRWLVFVEVAVPRITWIDRFDNALSDKFARRRLIFRDRFSVTGNALPFALRSDATRVWLYIQVIRRSFDYRLVVL